MQQPTNFTDWTTALNREAVNVWREAMAQVRRLSDDVWNGLRFFLSLNGVIIAGCAALIRVQDLNRRAIVVLMILLLVGLIITVFARKIMTKQRTYYLQMLRKKSLLEREMRFYETKLAGDDLSFIWSVPADELDEKADLWVAKTLAGQHSITRFLFKVYDLLILLYAVAFVLLVIVLLVKSA